MDFARLYWVNAVWLLLAAAFASAQTLNDPNLQVVEVAAGLAKPTTMAFIGPSDILVLQKEDGQVRRVLDGVLLPDPVLDLPVDFDGERGLLGIALHPAFPSVPLVYLYLTHSSTEGDTKGSPPPAGNRIYRFTWNGSILTDPSLIANLPATPARIHAGGVMTFGSDHKLYALIGDLDHRGALQNLPNGPAPDDTSVILRLNDDGTIPSDNPFVNQGGNLAKYYAYGIRNGFGLAFDAVTGKLWMTENGPDAYDEINLVEPGFNSGWIQLMGPLARNPRGVADLFQVPGSRYRDPVFSWRNTVGPTGIAFLTSSSLGERYRNHVFVGDITLGNLYHFSPNPSRNGFLFNDPALADLVADADTEFQETVFGTGFEGITDLKVGPDGRLYVLAFGLGKIFAISGADESDHWALVPGEGRTPSAPAATVLNGNLGLFARGTDNRLYVNWLLTNNQWSGWAPVPGEGRTPSAPAATVLNGNLGLFARGTDNRLYVNWLLTNNQWSGWAPVPGEGFTPSAPAATVLNGNLGLFARGTDDRLYVNWLLTNNQWSGWAPVPGEGFTPSAPAATVLNGNLGLFARGTDNRLYVNWLLPDHQWSGWALVPGEGLSASAPAVTVVDGDLGLFVRGIDDRLYANWLLPDHQWSGWAPVPGEGLSASAPAVTVVDGDLGLFVRGTDDRLYMTFPLGQ